MSPGIKKAFSAGETIFDKINTNKIKTGGYFREGKFDSKKILA